MEDFTLLQWHSGTQKRVERAKQRDQIDNEARLLWKSIVKTKHQSLTNLAFMRLVPGADRVVRHICIRCIVPLYKHMVPWSSASFSAVLWNHDQVSEFTVHFFRFIFFFSCTYIPSTRRGTFEDTYLQTDWAFSIIEHNAKSKKVLLLAFAFPPSWSIAERKPA